MTEDIHLCRCRCPIILALSTNHICTARQDDPEIEPYISIAKFYPQRGRHHQSIPTGFACPVAPAADHSITAPRQSLYPITGARQDFCPTFSLATFDHGDVVYCLGGASFRTEWGPYASSSFRNNYFKPSPDFFVHTSTTNPFRWDRLSSMSTPRYRPSVLTLNRKIYAFGCGITPVGNLKYFAEVYDTSEPSENAQWKPFIPTVTPYLGRSATARVDCSFIHNNTKVLIVFPSQNRAITVSLASGSSQSHTLGSSFAPVDSFTCSASPFVLPGNSNFVVVGDILFVFPTDSIHLHAIRLQNGNFQPNVIDSSDSVFQVEGPGFLPTYLPSFLFHTGGMRFLLVIIGDEHLFFFRFRVMAEGCNLTVVIDEESSYPHHGTYLVGATMHCECPVNLIEKKERDEGDTDR